MKTHQFNFRITLAQLAQLDARAAQLARERHAPVTRTEVLREILGAALGPPPLPPSPPARTSPRRTL